MTPPFGRQAQKARPSSAAGLIAAKSRKQVLPRVNRADRWRRYEQRKATFIALNPGATADQIEAFCQRVAKEEGV